MKTARIKKSAAAALLLCVALLFGGCPGHHSHNEPVIPNTLVIENHASSLGNMLYVYVSPSTSPIWSVDLLGMDILQPGEQLIMDVYDCNRRYDIMVEYGSGLIVIEPERWLPCNTTTVVSFVDY